MSDESFQGLKDTLFFGPEEIGWLRQVHAVLQEQVDDVLDTWYGSLACKPKRTPYLTRTTALPEAVYVQALRRRLATWMLDVTAAAYDRAWLDHQHHERLRHARDSAPVIPDAAAAHAAHLRSIVGLVLPLTVTLRPFLARNGHARTEIDCMEQAWFKAATLVAALWAQPLIPEQDA
ncbi:MAG TPA: protoglobin domain-containing protein [Ramlibacter sp.]|jgi:hypothetical protein|nr:protoglobin domain-containing protein [Ramlibacter sp.]